MYGRETPCTPAGVSASTAYDTDEGDPPVARVIITTKSLPSFHTSAAR